MKNKILSMLIVSVFLSFSAAMPIQESYAATTPTATAGKSGSGLDLVFAYSIGTDTATAVATGLNSGLNYETRPGQGWSILTGAGLKIISDYGDQLTRCYLFSLVGSNSMQCQLGAMSEATVMSKWNAYLQSAVVQGNVGNIVGFALSDDWYYAPGQGKELFKKMTASVHTYVPGHRSICIITANTSYAHSAEAYSKFAGALNFSPEGCDMVGFYLYPTVNKQPLTNFTNAIAGLKILGLDTSVTPIIGIAESYNTTGAAVEKEVKYMCDNGATSIGFWAYNTGMGTAAAKSPDIRAGMAKGIQYCGGSNGSFISYISGLTGTGTTGTGSTGTGSTGTGSTGSGSTGTGSGSLPAGASSGYTPGTSSGGIGEGSFTGDDEFVPEEEYDGPDYYDPGDSVTSANGVLSADAAKSLPDKVMAPIFPQLGNAPATATESCSVEAGIGGLVPCGRNTDDSSTDWNECKACDLCSFILMGQLTIELLMKIAVTATILFIIFAGFLYIFATGKANLISKAKLMIQYAITGFIVIFASWVMVNSMLTILGYVDPIEGQWYTIC